MCLLVSVLSQLGNIAGDSCEARDAVLRVGAVPALLGLLTSEPCRLSMLRNATWAVSNCVRGKPAPRWSDVESTLPVLSAIIAKGLDVEVLTDAVRQLSSASDHADSSSAIRLPFGLTGVALCVASVLQCWALSYLSDDSTPNNAHISAVIATGVIPHLVQLLLHPNPRILTPALRTLGNIVTGDDIQTSAVLNAGILPVLRNLLSHPRRLVRKEAVWALSNGQHATHRDEHGT